MRESQTAAEMGVFYRNVVRPILFLQDPEKAHDYGITALSALSAASPVCRMMEGFNLICGSRPIELLGLQFPNAVGMAAGMDKNGKCWQAAAALGFGHVEIGTVTSQKQPGNKRPRVFRYPQHEAIINRMGFNNEGAEAIAKRLKEAKGRRSIPLGINIGKSKAVPLDAAVEDYLQSFELLAPYADYFTINVSSPNTPDLRKLQGQDYLKELLAALRKANRARAKKLGSKVKPMLLKIAPDLSFQEIDRVLETLEASGFDGIIATNTTLSRPRDLAGDLKEDGGLSGRPLHDRSVSIVRYISHATGGRLPLIGSGGVCDAVSAGRMVDAGAHLVQVYTGFVYGGPFFAKELARALRANHSDWV